jgi:alpha-galactosidase
VTATIEFGFDSIKLDGCGAERDLDMYAALFNASGKSILIENCHWGGTVPNATWCPWNYFRSSGDITASYSSIVSNLQTTIQWAKSGLSQPGCWAYPDMLEVGVAPGVHPGEPGLTTIESRSHFGAWCVVSSPLILSHDLNNATLTAAIWPIISNQEAIAVNQAWYGFSGSVFKQPSETIVLGEKFDAVPIWQYWYKPISATQVAVLLMNHDSNTNALTLNFSDIPGAPCSSCKVRDIWAHQDLGTFSGSWSTSLASHDSAFLMISSQ